MFNSYSRPFYQSSDFLKLNRIDQKKYTNFIIKKFRETEKHISKEIVSDLLNWSDTYTFYVQNVFNKLWYVSCEQVSEEDIDRTKKQILAERNYIYLNFKNLLPKAQYNLLKAISENKGIEKPASKDFIHQYDLGTPSTVSTALKTLMNKEIVYREHNVYKIYDVFLARWLEID